MALAILNNKGAVKINIKVFMIINHNGSKPTVNKNAKKMATPRPTPSP